MAPARLGKPFRRLVMSTWLTNFGDGMAVAAGPLLVASQTSDPLLVAAAGFMRVLPMLLFGLIAGAVADRVNRKVLLIGCDLSRVGFLALLVGFVATGTVNIWLVLVVLFVMGTFEAFADTAGPALLPMLIDKEDLGLANSKLLVGYVTFNELIGPPIGAFLFAAGMVWPVVGQLILLVCGASVLARIALPASPTRTHIGHDIVEGARWLIAHPAMRTLALTVVTINVAFGAAWSVLVLYSRDQLGLGPVGFGLLTTMSGIGGIIGTTAYPWLEKRVSLGTIMRVGLLWETASHLILARTNSPAVAMGVMFLFGVHAFIWATTSTSVRQRSVPLELQGRVGATYLIGVFGGLLVGQVIGGVIARHWGVTAPLYFGFVASALILALIWRQLPRIAHDPH